MKPTIASRLANLSARLEELNALLSSEDATQDMDDFRRLTREHSEITPLVELYQSYRQNEQEIQSALELTSDPEMKELAEAEVDARADRAFADLLAAAAVGG